jgi:hypothetical protein
MPVQVFGLSVPEFVFLHAEKVLVDGGNLADSFTGRQPTAMLAKLGIQRI